MRYVFKYLFLLVLISFVLGGCETMSPQQCASADWLQGDSFRIAHKRVDLVNSEAELDGIAILF